MGKARFFLTGSLLFLLVNFYLDINQVDLFWLKNYLFISWLVFFCLLILSWIWRYFFWVFFIILAILRFYYFTVPENLTVQNFVFDKTYDFSAVIIDSDKKLNGWQIFIKPQDLKNYYGKILVNTPLYPEYDNQQIIQIKCRLQTPEPIASENGRQFFYDKYLAKDKVFAVCWRPQIKVIGQKKDFYSGLWSTQKFFLQNLNHNLVEPAGSLAKAMLFDKRREMSAELQTVFSQTGLSHVVAISGSHIVIIVWLLEIFLLSIFSRQKVFWLIMAILYIYLWLIGFPSSAARSGLMIFLLMVGPYLGRQTMSIYGLFLVADILVLLNPYSLVYDIGFQLSFLAVAGLIFYTKWWQKILFFITNRFQLREMISVTLAAQIFVWPVIVYYFGIFSVIAPLANIFILPLLPAILVLGLALAMLGAWYWLAVIISWPLFLLLKLMIWLSREFAQIPGAYFAWNDFDLIQFLSIMFAMIMLTFILKPHEIEIN